MSTYKPTEHDGLKEDGTPDMRVGSGSTYKPTDHGGLKEDGTLDKRVGTGEFAFGKVDPHEAGIKGAQASTQSGKVAVDSTEGEIYKPTEHGGLREDGQPDHRVTGNN